MANSATVEVTVYYEDDKSEPSGKKLSYLKIGDGAAIPIPDDVLPPRRLRRELVAAALEAAKKG